MHFIGLAYHHFNRPKNSFYRNPAIELFPKWVVSAGARFNVSVNSYFTLQADQNIQGPYLETIGGALYGYKIGEDQNERPYTVQMGTFLRWKDALIPVIKLDYSLFSVALSYDVNISQLKTASQSRGGFELSVSYVGFFRQNSSIDQVSCPRF